MSGSSAAKGFWVVSGSVLFAATIGWGAYNAGTLLGHDELTETTDFPAAQVQRVRIDNDAGPVTVRGTDGASASRTITLIARISNGVRDTEHHHEIVDGELSITASCPLFGSMWCGASYVLEVPHDTALRLEADNDRIRVEDITGSVEAHSDNGSVALLRVSGEVDATSDNGRISGRTITASTAVFATDNGSVDVQFAQPPTSVTARTSNGSVTVEVPEPDAYAVDATTDNGSVDVDVLQDPGSSRTIVASSDNGSVTVRYGS